MDEQPNRPERSLADMARDIEAVIPVTKAARDAAKDKRERKRLSGQLKVQRSLLRWIKSRVGYVAG